MDPLSAIGAIVGLVAQLRGIRDDRKASEVREKILAIVGELPEQIQDLSQQLGALVDKGDQDHERILEVLGQMSSRLQDPRPRVDFRVERAQYWQERAVAAEFYHMMDDPHKRGSGTMEPVGTFFATYIDVTNHGLSRTTIETIRGEVTVCGETWHLATRVAGGFIYCKRHDFTPASGALKDGERVELDQGQVRTIKICFALPKCVPDGMNRLDGTITCADIFGNERRTRCIFHLQGES